MASKRDVEEILWLSRVPVSHLIVSQLCTNVLTAALANLSISCQLWHTIRHGY